ncbi:Na+/H+ antiporter NhaC family protein [Bacillus sp. CMF21]|uniref:Na+/H+ antiporter NhaC family protein n=1 Tax=Metabacillus dongyingensis TaxID=2874282 RepID=UPI001CBBCE35|nr:Na+/H+ antiporter NhaC family protein [Metabacillus dongyingensis]UAL52523.1 Na+/H+ antiporter NhaC family protein [Metabacillus dongyingensis]UOK58211.1 Na+/H+ antiporter NhaC family protein [Bacillus sp. OVS6]USK28832.1 Na+/H+ antiporter NhaC family protein [Bacillus sp. CMF21]
METKGNGLALLPLIIFLALFVGSGIITGDFYKMPILVAIIIASGAALMMNRKETFTAKVENFAKGAGHLDLMIMVFIFILAGAFSEVAKGMGAVESTVNLALSFLPQSFLIVGLFIIGAFISLAMGTSMGTIAALAPIGVGISAEADISIALAMAAVIGGAMFGDNLSFISDTTIAAVRTQQTEMRDKFKVNFFIVLPAAIITCAVLIVITLGNQSPVSPGEFSFIKMLPYIAVLVTALLGMNVIIVLTGGILLSGVIGMSDGSYTLTDFLQKITEGIMGMAELVILSLLIGGMVELIKRNGGIHFILEAMTKRISSKRGAEYAIAGLVSTTNLATANNTISIIAAGPLAKDMADKYEIDKRKSASLLDIFSCSIQGLIPYGAQMLTAAQFAKISPADILPFSYYPFLIAVMGIAAIIIGYPKFKKAK